ncbi:hypothetical protein [Dyella choica]|nr:hypothetical protein [Dyella choica]
MLIANRARTLILSASVLIMGCAIAKPTTVSLSAGGIQASAKLGKASINSATQAHFVHAQLTLDDKAGKLKAVNLNCFVLVLNEITSDEIHVDSMASVLTDPYPADAKGRIQVPVYWVFSAQNPVDISLLPTARLSIRPGMSSCFHY